MRGPIVLGALAGVALLLAAATLTPRGSESSLLQVVTMQGRKYALVPVSEIGNQGGRGGLPYASASQGKMQGQQRMRASFGGLPWAAGPGKSLFGPGDLPMPINDWDSYDSTPGSNVFFYNHVGRMPPTSMDDYPDPPWSIGGGTSFEDPNY